MGFLTTITIKNDYLDLIQENPQQFVDMILVHANGPYDYYTGYGVFANKVLMQRSRHSETMTVYVQDNNAVVELNQHSERTKQIAKQSPQYFRRLVEHLRNELEDLEALVQRDVEEKVEIEEDSGHDQDDK